MDQLPMVIQEVNANLLRYTLVSLNPIHRYYICFDQLDLGFDPNNREYVSRLIGLLLACRDINIAARNNGRQLLVAVFLRDDIYDTLHFEDRINSPRTLSPSSNGIPNALIRHSVSSWRDVSRRSLELRTKRQSVGMMSSTKIKRCLGVKRSTRISSIARTTGPGHDQVRERHTGAPHAASERWLGDVA